MSHQRCVRGGRISLDPARRHDSSVRAVKDQKRLAPGDILVNSTGVGTLGRTAQILTVNQPVTADSHLTIVRPNPEVDARWLAYAVSAAEPEIEAMAEGSTGQTELSRHRLAILTVVLPPFEEQRAIAATLGALDDKIESNRRTFRLLLSLADELFAQSIDHKALSSIPFDDVVHRLQVKHKHSGKSVAPSGRTIVLDQGRNGTLGYHDGDPEFMGTPDSPICLFGDHTCTWRLGLGAFDVGPNVVPVVAKEDSPVDSLWMFFGLRGVQKFQEYRRHWMEFKLHEVPWVDEITQSSFVSVARPMVAMIHELDAQSKRLSEVRDALLPEVFSGRIRVLVEGIDE